MPSTRPQAAFEPISPEFDVKALVEATPNFEYVVRIHCDMIDHQGIEAFEKLILIHVILGGKPLVVEGYETRLDRWTFALQWLRDNCGSKVENARDLTKRTNVPLTIGHYLNNMALLTNQWSTTNFKDPDRQRMYLKDIDCPQLWRDKLEKIIPTPLFYLNETTGDVGGYGSVDEPDPDGPGMRRGQGIAKAGDLMSSLPTEMRAENLMCYIGHEGTYTPAHREMCASLGQNIMVEASTGITEDNKPTIPGSSIWFMTESKDREVVSEYWLSKLGHDIELENHFAQVNAWKNAPFKTYVVEQKPGDFILIPPLAPHQVWNRGTRTMKVAWNRTTLETLEMALNEALPRSRMVCRDEQYKNKAIVYYTLQKYSKLLRMADKFKHKKSSTRRESGDTKVRQLQKDFRRLHNLYTQILVSETFVFEGSEKKIELVPFDSNITCSYCRCNIFNRFLTCSSCVGDLGDGEKDTYDVCMECYAMGRSCACISKLKWVEQFPWKDLVDNHEKWRHQILAHNLGSKDNAPMSLKIEMERRGAQRTLAQICQLELIKRPWRDVTKPPPVPNGVEREEEVEVDANGNVKKKQKIRRSEKFLREHGRCHVDCYWEPKWKQAQCSTCEKNYCYGLLFRAYDMMPQDIMADPGWKCPSCLKICGCRQCRPKPGYKPYIPSGTLLGHNTKAVADPRSVESLVDFSYSNIGWIQKAGDDNGEVSKRLLKRKKDADAAKAQDPELGDDYVEANDEDGHDAVEAGILRLAEQEGIPIDPALGNLTLESPSTPVEDEDRYDENPEGPRSQDNGSIRLPLAPQYLVPEGGIIRNSEHAYDQTEAITYDYPDPDATLTAPVVPAEENNKTDGYMPAEADDTGEIEMVDRKRKRLRLEEGDRPYKFKKGNPNKQKKRQSLVVKLPVDKTRLAELNQKVTLARQANNEISDVPAPKINSDLQALNVKYPSIDAQPLLKKPRTESIVVNKDDDFTPSRYRDRRKGTLEGEPRLPPDADITRRQTRMANVTYEEPSEDDEMSDDAETAPASRTQSKRVMMEKAINDDINALLGDSDAELQVEKPTTTSITKDVDQVIPQHTDRSPLFVPQDGPPPVVESNLPVSKKQAPTSVRLAEPIKDRQQISAASQYVPPSNSAAKNIPSRQVPPSTAKSSVSPPSIPNKKSSTKLADAQANRMAKMAAVQWMEHDSSSLDDAWSEDEEPQTEKQQHVPTVPQSPTLPSSTTSGGVTSTKPSSVSIRPAPQSAPKSPTQAHQNHLTSEKAKVTVESDINIHKQPNKSTPQQSLKVSVSDWADSDSEDDFPIAKKPSVPSKPVNGTTGWVSINGHGAVQKGLHRPPPSNAGPKPMFAKRGRGRPPMY